MAKRFNVKIKAKKDGRKHKKGDWINVRRRWRGRVTSEFSWGKARMLAKAIDQSAAFESDEVRVKMVKPKKKKRPTKRQRERKLIAQRLRGDLDATHKLLYRLALVAQELDIILYVAEGKRTVAEQWKYWYAYKRGTGPLAAFPGTSNHTWGRAADVRLGKAQGTPNIGDIPGARKAMKKWGLCLPVPGETWHVEIGTRWAN